MWTALQRPGNYLQPGRAQVVTATVALATRGDAARTAIGALLPAGPNSPVARAYALRILLAEAERRAGDLAAARRHLAEGLRHGAGCSDFTLTMPGVVTAGLLAADLGDHPASRDLAGRWEAVRRRLGLPAPLGYADTVHQMLGLDPAAPAGPDPDHAWNPDELGELVAHAHAWAAAEG